MDTSITLYTHTEHTIELLVTIETITYWNECTPGIIPFFCEETFPTLSVKLQCLKK